MERILTKELHQQLISSKEEKFYRLLVNLVPSHGLETNIERLEKSGTQIVETKSNRNRDFYSV